MEMEEQQTDNLAEVKLLASKIKPVGFNILVTSGRTERTSGGIIKPNAHSTYDKHSFVLAVGEEVKVCKVGDRILIEEAAYKEYTFDEVKMGIMHQAQVKAVISEDLNVE